MALPELDTERLHLRPWHLDEVEAFHEIWGDPEVIWWGAMADVDASRELLARVIDIGPGLGWAAIVSKDGGTVVGNAALQPTPGDRTDIEVGWHLARRHWGNGYATEASGALIEHAFTTLRLDRVVADIVPGNERSARVAARLGLRPEDRTARAGRRHDVWVLRREDWLSGEGP